MPIVSKIVMTWAGLIIGVFLYELVTSQRRWTEALTQSIFVTATTVAITLALHV